MNNRDPWGHCRVDTFKAGFSLSLLSPLCAFSYLTGSMFPIPSVFFPLSDLQRIHSPGWLSLLFLAAEMQGKGSRKLCLGQPLSPCWGPPLTAGILSVWHVFLSQYVAYVKDLSGIFSAFMSSGHCFSKQTLNSKTSSLSWYHPFRISCYNCVFRF